MATSYIASATAQTDGAGFSLSAGTSRLFYCVPNLTVGESLTVQISDDSGTTWNDVGEIVTHAKRAGTLTAQGQGASYFRVNKSATGTATEVVYD